MPKAHALGLHLRPMLCNYVNFYGSQAYISGLSSSYASGLCLRHMPQAFVSCLDMGWVDVYRLYCVIMWGGGRGVAGGG
jgi:hypothetical protein